MQKPPRHAQGDLGRREVLRAAPGLYTAAVWPLPQATDTDDSAPKAAASVWSHGIAMYGQPELPANCAFAYVNTGAPKGGRIRQSVTGTFESLNPIAARGRTPPGLTPQVIEPLMQRAWDEPFSLYGLLARDVAVPSDHSWVEFRLDPDARWHDGQPVTTDDVRFSFEAFGQHGLPARRRMFQRVSRIIDTGPKSIRFQFNDADDRELPLLVALTLVLPSHWWKGRNPAEALTAPLLGSGPYRVAEIDIGRSVTYERAPGWWGSEREINRGLHNFDSLQYVYFRDDGIALEAFNAGTIDLRREGNPSRWSTGYRRTQGQQAHIRREILPRKIPEPFRAIVLNTRRPLFLNPQVREALALAFDYEWINRTLFDGAFTRTASIFPNSELAHAGIPNAAERELLEPFRAMLPAALFERPFTPPVTDGTGLTGLRPNLRRAWSLLQSAGFRTQNGHLVKNTAADPIHFEIILNGPSDERVALEWSRSLTRLGIVANIRILDSAQYQGRIDQLDFDATIHRWISTLSPGIEQLSYWGSDNANATGTRNIAGIRHPAVDHFARRLVTASTRQDLLNAAHALDRTIMWGWYMIPLYHLTGDHVAYWDRICRPDLTPTWGIVTEAWWSRQ